jgi:hypothetical protein
MRSSYAIINFSDIKIIAPLLKKEGIISALLEEGWLNRTDSGIND